MARTVLLCSVVLLHWFIVEGVGQTGAADAADEETQALIEPFQREAQKKARALGWDGIWNKWDAKLVRKQLVAGMNYFVKVAISDVSCVHLRIYVPLPHTKKPNELVGIQVNHAHDSELSYFQPAPDAGEL
eukprot:TRINITY_DN19744_c0_g2_i1.p1 TRINITY_DN19744_c0_g2~~TRINITY_DN19744_c0_g2_i1.p1  ORF type:complete len:131 (+),score=19.42 TRINITY_DN19744_c0_g2_i1:127-519(+)